MTTTTNLETASHGTTGKNTNNEEMAIVKIQTNIRGIIQNNTKFLAGVIIGGMIAAASILPWSASAESPASPAADVDAASSISSQGQHSPEVDDWVSLTYREKLVPANAPSAMNYTELDDWISLTYSE